MRILEVVNDFFGCGDRIWIGSEVIVRVSLESLECDDVSSKFGLVET